MLERDYYNSSGLIVNLLNSRVNGELYEFTKDTIHQHCYSKRRKTVSYASKAWYNKTSELLYEYDDRYIFGWIAQNGEFADFRPRKYTAYKSLDVVKQKALEYIDSEIEKLTEKRKQIENEY